MAYAVTKKESRRNAGAVESQQRLSPLPTSSLESAVAISTFPAAPTNSFYILISVDGRRSLRPLSSRQCRFAPIVIGFAPESLIVFTSESLIDFAGIPTSSRMPVSSFFNNSMSNPLLPFSGPSPART